jgi:transcriptional regulator with XRE-family HTH domain
MKEMNTADRLKQIMNERGLKQVDILEACKPYCDKYGVKLKKNDLSQYVSGKVIPKQDKLSILAMALNVNEVWLMGYEVPSDKDYQKWNVDLNAEKLSEEAGLMKQIQDTFGLSTKQAVELFIQLDTMDQGGAIERMKIMLEDKKYSVQKESSEGKVI